MIHMQRRAVRRMLDAQRALDATLDEWERHPYDPEKKLAVAQRYHLLDDAIAICQEFSCSEAGVLTTRVGAA